MEKAIKKIEDGDLKKAAREVEDAKRRLDCNDPPQDQDPTIAEACQELSKIEFITDNVTSTLTVILSGRRRLGKSQKQEVFDITEKSAKTLQDTVTQIVTDSLSDVQGLDQVVVVSADNLGNGNLNVIQTLVLEELCGTDDCAGQNQSGETQVFQDVTGAINSAIANGEFTSVLKENVAKCGKGCAQLVGAIVTDEANFVSNSVVVSFVCFICVSKLVQMHHTSSHTKHVFLCISLYRLAGLEATQSLPKHPLALAVQRARKSRHRHQARSLPRMRTALARTRTISRAAVARFGYVDGRMMMDRQR